MDHESSTDYWGHKKRLVGLTAAVLLAGLFMRGLYLDSDPYYILWTGYITDEGRWTEQARNFALFGSFNFDGWLSRIHFILSPLFQALTFASFSLFGVSFSSARLVSAICGGVLLIASFFFLRRRFTPEALLFSITALALQPDLLFLSRVGIPEMAAMLFEFLAFMALISAPQTAMKSALAGLLTLIALGFKATVAPIVAIFMIILVCTRRSDTSSSLVVRLSAYVGVLIAPAVIVVVALQLDDAFVTHLWSSLESLKAFVALSSPYSIISFLFYGEVTPVLNLLLLGAWLMAGLFISTGRLPATRATLIYTSTAIWVLGWLLISAGLEYFPHRYVFHVLVPLILHLGAGVTLLQTLDWPVVLKNLSQIKGARLVIVSLWLSLPLAGLLCPIIIAMVDIAGYSIERFREQLPLLVILNVLLALFLRRTMNRQLAGFCVVVLPLIFTLFWLIGVQSGSIRDVYWNSGSFETLLALIVLLAISSIVTIKIGMNRIRPNFIRRSGILCLVAFGGIWLYQSLPGLVNPGYSIAEASAGLERFADKDKIVGTRSAASLFLNNKLRYTEQFHGKPLPEILVVAFDKTSPKILDNYRIIHQYELQFAEGPSSESILKIYKRQY